MSCKGLGLGLGLQLAMDGAYGRADRLLQEAINLNDMAATFTRATSAFHPSALQIVPVGARRRRVMARIGSRLLMGDLMENTKSNKLASGTSEHFELWTLTDTTVTADAALSPTNVMTADLCTEGVAGTALVANAATITANNNVSASVYLKAGTATWIRLRVFNGADIASAWFNISTGAVGSTAVAGTASAQSSSIEAAPGGWYRCIISALVNAGSTAITFDICSASADASTTRVNGATYYGWGAMFEQAKFASSFISNRNLMLQSETLGTTWAATRSTVTSNVVADPLTGNTTADQVTEDATAGNSHVISQNFVKAASSLTFTASAYFKSAVGSRNMRLAFDDNTGSNGVQVIYDFTGAVQLAASTFGSGFSAPSSTITALGNGWYRVTITGTTNTAANVRMVPGLASGNTGSYNGDNTSALYIWGCQLEYGTQATTYWATSTAIGLRAADSLNVSLAAITDPRTNRFKFSEQLDNAQWTHTDTTITANALNDPNGNAYADLVTEGSAGTAALQQIPTGVAGTNHVYSKYLKVGNTNWIRLSMFNGSDIIKGWFNLTTGLAGSVTMGGTSSGATITMTSVGNGWYRCSISGVVNAGSTAITCSSCSAAADASSSRVNGATYYVWGAQFESIASIGPYLPTTATAVTAAQTGLDCCNGTIIAVLKPYGWTGDQDGTNYRYMLDGDSSNDCTGARNGATTLSISRADAGGNNTLTPTHGLTNGVVKTVANTWSPAAHSAYINGVAAGSVTTLQAPFNLVASLAIGMHANGTAQFYGETMLLLYKRALSAAEILAVSQALGAP